MYTCDKLLRILNIRIWLSDQWNEFKILKSQILTKIIILFFSIQWNCDKHNYKYWCWYEVANDLKLNVIVVSQIDMEHHSYLKKYIKKSYIFSLKYVI